MYIYLPTNACEYNISVTVCLQLLLLLIYNYVKGVLHMHELFFYPFTVLSSVLDQILNGLAFTNLKL